MDTGAIGKILILFGVTTTIVGLLGTFLPKIPFLGRLPGDAVFQTEHLKVIAPITTCIVLSIVLTIIINVVLAITRK